MGTALAYPTLLAAVGDRAHPAWRSSAVGTYRLWRDLGYPVGALLAGGAADLLGAGGAIWLVAAVTFASGALAFRLMAQVRQRGPATEGRSAATTASPAASGRG
jgi:hypothetical protein